MTGINITEEIVLLLRGFFATPIISSLGRSGILEIMLTKQIFVPEDFLNIPNKKLLNDSFRYFSRIGLLELQDSQENRYKVSELGKEVFQRSSSFYVPHSYYEYMYNYNDQLLNSATRAEYGVERLENVIGSGKTHLRYFPPAISFLKRKVNFDVMVDIGCGDGHFLSEFIKSVLGKAIVGIDISKLAIDVTYKNLRALYPASEIEMICSDAFDLNKWGARLKNIANGRSIAISMWFLIHEISKNDPKIIIKYLNDIHDMFPNAPLIICELVRHPDLVLANNRKSSFMSEYLLFHELSGQGILSWEEYQNISNNIPYKIMSERLFDEIADGEGGRLPSSFVWCLLPK